MPEIGRYDADLEMFVEDHPINYDILSFLRWLLESGRLHDDDDSGLGE